MRCLGDEWGLKQAACAAVRKATNNLICSLRIWKRESAARLRHQILLGVKKWSIIYGNPRPGHKATRGDPGFTFFGDFFFLLHIFTTPEKKKQKNTVQPNWMDEEWKTILFVFFFFFFWSIPHQYWCLMFIVIISGLQLLVSSYPRGLWGP